MKQKWAELAKLANLVFDSELRKSSELRQAQANLGLKRRRLDVMNRKALDALVNPHPVHRHDGDVLWQAWVGQNARAIGLEQAKLRALTEIHKSKLRKAFGRKSVLEELARR